MMYFYWMKFEILSKKEKDLASLEMLAYNGFECKTRTKGRKEHAQKWAVSGKVP